MWTELFLKNNLPVAQGIRLADHTSLGVGGEASLYSVPDDRPALIRLIAFCREKQIPFRLLGRGTNLLVSDALRPQTIISTRKLNRLSKCETYITAECGVSLRSLAKFAMEQKMIGVAGLFDSPGTVGAAIRGNAGAFGYAMHQYLHSVEVYDAAKRTVRFLSPEALLFGYRSSALLGMRDVFLLSASFAFPTGAVESELEKIQKCRTARASSQPLGIRSCGSVFRRYEGVGAGFYLEKAGCKGLRRGGAQISEKHANFIVNLSDASYDDVSFLIDEARERVYRKFGIWLLPEIERII